MTAFNTGGISPQMMQLILARQAQGSQGPQFPQQGQRLPQAPQGSMSMSGPAPQQPAGQQGGGLGAMMPLVGALGGKSPMGGGSSGLWDLPSWLTGSGGTQAIGATPYGTAMMAPNVAGGSMFGGGMQVGGGLGNPSMLTQLGGNGMADSIPGASGFMSGGGGGLFGGQAGMMFDGAGSGAMPFLDPLEGAGLLTGGGEGAATAMLPTSASALTAGGGLEGAGMFGGMDLGGMLGLGDLFGLGGAGALGIGAGEGLMAGGAAEGIGATIAANPELLMLLA